VAILYHISCLAKGLIVTKMLPNYRYAASFGRRRRTTTNTRNECFGICILLNLLHSCLV